MRPWTVLANTLRRKGQQNFAETAVVVGEAIDESNLLAGLATDILSAVESGEYVLKFDGEVKLMKKGKQ